LATLIEWSPWGDHDTPDYVVKNVAFGLALGRYDGQARRRTDRGHHYRPVALSQHGRNRPQFDGAAADEDRGEDFWSGGVLGVSYAQLPRRVKGGNLGAALPARPTKSSRMNRLSATHESALDSAALSQRRCDTRALGAASRENLAVTAFVIAVGDPHRRVLEKSRKAAASEP
jgi:hypothetical protein